MTSAPTLTLGRTLALGSLVGLTYAAFESRRLATHYPLHQGSSAPPSSVPLWPTGVGSVYEFRAITRIPRGADPRETLLAAFYDTWTLRVEAFMHRTFGIGIPEPPASGTTPTTHAAPKFLQVHERDPEFASRPLALPYTPPPTPATPATRTSTPAPAPDTADTLPAAYASGLFAVLGRTAEATMVWWGSVKGAGGAQLITCTRVPNSQTGEVQISYACAETPFLDEGSIGGRIATTFHRMYMRYLLDRAAQRMEGWTAMAERQE